MTWGIEKMLVTSIFSFSHYVFTFAATNQTIHVCLFFCLRIFLTFYPTLTTLMPLRKQSLENIMGKGENPGNQHFLLFKLYFYQRKSATFEPLWNCHLQMLSGWTRLKFCQSGKGLILDNVKILLCNKGLEISFCVNQTFVFFG